MFLGRKRLCKDDRTFHSFFSIFHLKVTYYIHVFNLWYRGETMPVEKTYVILFGL